jgi:Ca-activated chloride channel family protein
MVGIAITALAVVIAAGAEWLHSRRVAKVASLAFGPNARPRRWVRAVPLLRVLAVGGATWGLWILFSLKPAALVEDASPKSVHHIVIALDVSPSMDLYDSGPGHKESRAQWGRKVLMSILDRVDMSQTRVSIVAFYTDARPVVVDTFDPNVVENILDDLPLEHAFDAGKTDLYKGVGVAMGLAKKWRAGSTTLIVLSDGDTLPKKEMDPIPPAVTRTIVIGVGNPHHGKFIDGHSSRQDARSLQRLALKLKGVYHNGFAKHVSSDEVSKLAEGLPVVDQAGPGLREWALMSMAAGIACLALVPMALAVAGSSWRGGLNPKSNQMNDSQGAKS